MANKIARGTTGQATFTTTTSIPTRVAKGTWNVQDGNGNVLARHTQPNGFMVTESGSITIPANSIVIGLSYAAYVFEEGSTSKDHRYQFVVADCFTYEPFPSLPDGRAAANGLGHFGFKLVDGTSTPKQYSINFVVIINDLTENVAYQGEWKLDDTVLSTVNFTYNQATYGYRQGTAVVAYNGIPGNEGQVKQLRFYLKETATGGCEGGTTCLIEFPSAAKPNGSVDATENPTLPSGGTPINGPVNGGSGGSGGSGTTPVSCGNWPGRGELVITNNPAERRFDYRYARTATGLTPSQTYAVSILVDRAPNRAGNLVASSDGTLEAACEHYFVEDDFDANAKATHMIMFSITGPNCGPVTSECPVMLTADTGTAWGN